MFSADDMFLDLVSPLTKMEEKLYVHCN